MFVSFADKHSKSKIWIPKQIPPSPLPVFTPSLITATSLSQPALNLTKCQITRLQQIQNSLARAFVKALKSSHITPILRSLHWLKITECKLLLLTNKVLTTTRPSYLLLLLTNKVLTTTRPSYLHNIITVQPPRSTLQLCSKSLVHPHHLLYE